MSAFSNYIKISKIDKPPSDKRNKRNLPFDEEDSQEMRSLLDLWEFTRKVNHTEI